MSKEGNNITILIKHTHNNSIIREGYFEIDDLSLNRSHEKT